MEAEKPFFRIVTDDRYRLYVPKTRLLTELAWNLGLELPLTSGEMYYIMRFCDQPLTRENCYGKQLYEETQNNTSDEAYAESPEGKWERAVRCVEETGWIPLGDKGRLELVQLKRLRRGVPNVDGNVELLVHRRDYNPSFIRYMSVEGIIDTFERSEDQNMTVEGNIDTTERSEA